MPLTQTPSGYNATGLTMLTSDIVCTGVISVEAGATLDCGFHSVTSYGGIVLEAGDGVATVCNGIIRGNGTAIGIHVLNPNFLLQDLTLSDPTWPEYQKGLHYEWIEGIRIETLGGAVSADIIDCKVYGFQKNGIVCLSNDIKVRGLHLCSQIRGGNTPNWGFYTASSTVLEDFHLWGDCNVVLYLDGAGNRVSNGQIERGNPTTILVNGNGNVINGDVVAYDNSPTSAFSQTVKPVGIQFGTSSYDGLNNTGGYCENTVAELQLGIPGSGNGFLGGAVVKVRSNNDFFTGRVEQMAGVAS